MTHFADSNTADNLGESVETQALTSFSRLLRLVCIVPPALTAVATIGGGGSGGSGREDEGYYGHVENGSGDGSGIAGGGSNGGVGGDGGDDGGDGGPEGTGGTHHMAEVDRWFDEGLMSPPRSPASTCPLIRPRRSCPPAPRPCPPPPPFSHLALNSSASQGSTDNTRKAARRRMLFNTLGLGKIPERTVWGSQT